jgi:hypothetical protein
MKTIDTLPKQFLVLLFTAIVVFLLPANASAQICAGSSLRYVVRDKKGKVIDPTDIYETKTRSAIDELKDAQKAVKGVDGNVAKVILASGMCNFREPVKLQVSLNGKVMNLTFLMPVLGEYASRSFLVDSIPFRAGAFEINLAEKGEANPAGEWLGGFFPAKGWKKVVNKP